MSERPLSPGKPVRKGQLVLSTECSICHQTQRNPTNAAKHVQRHRKQQPKSENNPLQLREQGVNRAQNGGVPDTLVCLVTCLDRGANWESTPCLCGCHYQGLTARQWMKQYGQEAEHAD